jgi:tRNA-dihydrouridine synthase B
MTGANDAETQPRGSSAAAGKVAAKRAAGPPILHLAPLHGVTNRIYRAAWFRHFAGFDAAMAPFILAVTTRRPEAKHFKDVEPSTQAGVPLIPQLLGNDGACLVATGKILEDMGYAEIDWNLGCPYPMVANKKRGSGLLPYPELVDRALEAMCSTLAAALSVKIRLGRNSSEELGPVMETLNRYPLSRVIVHPRIGTQMYKGTVDLDGFDRALELCSRPVMYNGDIVDVASFDSLSARFPSANGWMIGRGALRDPFLPARIKARAGMPRAGSANAVSSGGATVAATPTARTRTDERAILRAFHDDLADSYREALSGDAHFLDKMKEAWTYLGASFPGRERELAKIARAKTGADYRNAVGSLFGG